MLFGVFISAVLLKLLFKRLKAAVKRHGWPLVTLFLVCSAWATYTAFPTSEEKDEYRQSQNEQTEINSAWAGIYGVDGTVTFDGATSIAGFAQAGVASTEGDSAQTDAQAPATTNEVVDALSTYELTAEDFARGFVLTCVGTNEVHNFIPYGNSIVCADWLAHGAAEDWIYLRDERWEMGGEKLRIHSEGVVKVFKGSDSLYAASGYYPFKTVLGIVPEANWHLLGNGEWGTGNWGGSLFWHEVTSLNTLKLTWQNVLYNRTTETPVSFEIEYDEKGDFIYRYDFTSVRNKIASSEWGENWASNVVIGVIGDDAQHSFFIDTSSTSLLLCDSALKTNVITALKTATLSSLTFQHLEHDDAPGSDRDGDGLTLEEELFVYHTDPYSADTDLDGLSDYDEVVVYGTDPHDVYSANGNYIDGLAVKLGRLDPFSYPEGSTNTVLEHVFYSGTTNGVFAYPQSSDSVGILKVMVTGAGTGRLVVGEAVVPLVPPPMTRSLAQTNTLLLAVGKGVKKSIWFTKPNELQVSIDSADLLIGEIPSLLCPKGWIAFPHTDATVPCIHDFCSKGRTVTLVHGEEFEGLTASWSSDENDVVITNVAPVSAEIYGRFKKDQTREISYTVNHPDQLNRVEAKFTQTLRFCPPFSEDDEPPEELPEEDPDEKYRNCMCDENTPCVCSPDEWCFCYSPTCRCNENRSPTITDNEDDQTVCTNILESLPPLSDVLYLYRDNSRTFALPVPEGEARRCCPCPEHSKSNYVSMALYTSRLAVKDAVGQDFNISYEPCDVTVSGVSPSRAFRDSTVNFITNGVLYKRVDYTVLGVDIARPEGEVSVERYNELSSELGYPFEICTNFENAVSLLLRTDVKLETGYVKISLEDATGDIKLWLPSWYDNDGTWHDYEVLLDSQAKCVRYMSMSKWRGILRRYWSDRELEVKVTSATPGSCKLKLEYIASDGSHSIHDFDELRITSVAPLLLADYNKDGNIDADDISMRLLGRKFRYWVNECKIVGSVWEEPSLFEAIVDIFVGTENWRNQHVDGAYDLINLFPLAVDFGPFITAWGNDVQFKITTEYADDVLNYTFAKIAHSSAGEIRTSPHTDIYGTALTNAPLAVLDEDGVSLTRSEALSYDEGACLMVAEARKVADSNLKMAVIVGGEEMYSCRLPIKTSSVDDMFRFVNIRSAHENEMTDFSGTAEPSNNPDSELAIKDVFFVHGFNVSEEGARNWNREMFKRFWVSGMNARYWGVTWEGDYHVIFEEFNGAHYHRDVRQALLTAPTFRNLVNQYGHDAVVIGHSLGNMVVSEGLLKGANAKTYIMLDAAVASEAYRPGLQADTTEIVDKYVPADWDGYHPRAWAANWYTWFTNNTNDARADIGWAGHFAPLLNKPDLEVYNFYSSGDEVFAEATAALGLATGVFHWPTFSLSWPFVDIDFTLDAFPWQKQEVFKGVNAAGSLSAGWGFHCWVTNIEDKSVWVMYSAEGANLLVNNGSIPENPVFDRGISEMFASTISDYDKADILAFHIPAVSSPAGKVAIRDALEEHEKDFDLNYSDFRDNGWGRDKLSDDSDDMPWLHSDIKNMSYFFIYPAFEIILEKGNLR